MSVIEKINQHKILSVIRGADQEQIVKISDALYAGGVYILEITMETKNAEEVIKTAIQHKKAKELIGAGTVTDVDTALRAIKAGAEFIVTPVLNANVLKVCKKHNIVSIIGSLTPTEIHMAYSHGADMVKVFPAEAFGPSYIKGIKAPLPRIPIIPTGGINLNNIKDYYLASEIAVGIGGSLVNTRKLSTEADYKALEEKARAFSQALHELENE